MIVVSLYCWHDASCCKRLEFCDPVSANVLEGEINWEGFSFQSGFKQLRPSPAAALPGQASSTAPALLGAPPPLAASTAAAPTLTSAAAAGTRTNGAGVGTATSTADRAAADPTAPDMHASMTEGLRDGAQCRSSAAEQDSGAADRPKRLSVALPGAAAAAAAEIATPEAGNNLDAVKLEACNAATADTPRDAGAGVQYEADTRQARSVPPVQAEASKASLSASNLQTLHPHWFTQQRVAAPQPNGMALHNLALKQYSAMVRTGTA